MTKQINGFGSRLLFWRKIFALGALLASHFIILGQTALSNDERLKLATRQNDEGEKYFERNDFRAALPFFRKAYEIRKELLPEKSLPRYRSTERLAVTTEDLKERITLLTEAQKVASDLFKKEEANLEHKDIGDRLFDAYTELGDPVKAEDAQRNAWKLRGEDYDAFKKYLKELRAFGPSDEEREKEQQKYAEEAQKAGEAQTAAFLKRFTNGISAEALKRQVPAPNRTLPAAPNNVEIENFGRAYASNFAKLNPEMNAALQRVGLDFSRRPDRNVKKQFKDQWETWNSQFEDGTPLRIILAGKGQELAIFSNSPTPEADSVSELVINLKGLLLAREFNLMEALNDKSAFPSGTDPREVLWKAENDAALRMNGENAEASKMEKEIAAKLNETVAGLTANMSAADKAKVEARLKAQNSSGFPAIFSSLTRATAPEASDEEMTLRRIAASQVISARPPILSVEQVSQQIPADSALAIYFQYGNDTGGEGDIPIWYGVAVLAPGKSPKWTPVGEKTAIDKAASDFGSFIQGKPAERRSADKFLSELFQSVWAPCASLIPANSKTVFISPDGALHSIPFSALRADGSFLCEKYAIRYLPRPRDIMRQGQHPQRGQAIELFVDPDYSLGLPVAPQREQSFLGRIREYLFTSSTESSYSFLERRFDPLPRTRSDAVFIEEAAKKANLTNVHLHAGADASENALSKIKSPFVLHIGAHGFMDPASPSGPQFGPLWDRAMEGSASLYRSGLALAGASSTQKGWKTRTLPSPSNDGIVSGIELSRLDLRGTWLTTLAACDTGVGNTIAGEGLLALQLGLFQAGTENLIYTLWKIDDEASSRFFRDFYGAAFPSGDAGGAMAKVQKETMLKASQSANPDALWQSVRLASAFILSERNPLKN